MNARRSVQWPTCRSSFSHTDRLSSVNKPFITCIWQTGTIKFSFNQLLRLLKFKFKFRVCKCFYIIARIVTIVAFGYFIWWVLHFLCSMKLVSNKMPSHAFCWSHHLDCNSHLNVTSFYQLTFYMQTAMSLQCDYSNRGHLTKFSTNLTTTYHGG